MSDKVEVSGGCLCGAVRFKVGLKDKSVGACHCGMCRRWSGGVFLVVDCGGDIQFEKDADLDFFQSSDHGERGFCKKCGSSLFWKMQGEESYFVSSHSLDDLGGLALDHEIFIDDKPGYYDFSNETKKMTGEEVFAYFSAQNEEG